jgi:hypothetical protein
MNDVPGNIVAENYEKFKAMAFERGDKFLMTAVGGPAPPPQPYQTPEQITSTIMGLLDNPLYGDVKLGTIKSRGPSIPLFAIDDLRFVGYRPGEYNIIALPRSNTPSPIVRNDDGSIFVPLECTAEEGEAIMPSLTRKK